MGPVPSKTDRIIKLKWSMVVDIRLIHQADQHTGWKKSTLRTFDYNTGKFIESLPRQKDTIVWNASSYPDDTWKIATFIGYYLFRDNYFHSSLLESEPCLGYRCSGVTLVGGNPLCMLFLLSRQNDCSFRSFIVIEPKEQNTHIDLIAASFLFPISYKIVWSWSISLIVQNKTPGERPLYHGSERNVMRQIVDGNNKTLYYRMTVMFANLHMNKIIPRENIGVKFDARESQMKQLNVGYLILHILANLSRIRFRTTGWTIIDPPAMTDEYGIFVVKMVTQNEYHFVVFDKLNQCTSMYVATYLSPKVSLVNVTDNLLLRTKHLHQNNEKYTAWLKDFNPTHNISEIIGDTATKLSIDVEFEHMETIPEEDLQQQVNIHQQRLLQQS
jgi:hypothetical protein